MRGEPIHCLIRMEIGSQNGRLRERIELEQEAGDVVIFALNPGSNCRISLLASVRWMKNDCAN
jgi:hypothetical protein